MSMKAFVPLAIFGALVVMFGVGLTLRPNDLPSEFIDEPVPEFELESLFEGEPPVTAHSLEGQVYLINVFGSWCRTCIVEHPFLMELKEAGAIHMVGLDWRDERDAALRWLTTRGNPYDIIGFDEFSEVAIGLGVTGAPETFLVGPDGRIRFKHVGALNEHIWERDFLPKIQELRAGVVS